MALAEGATNDARGAMAVVGVNQRVIPVVALPFSSSQRVVMTLTDEIAGSDGHEFDKLFEGSVSINVISPSGTPTFTTNEDVKFDVDKQWVDLPLVANIVIEVNITGDTHGVYIVETTLTPNDDRDPVVSRYPVYIVDPQRTIHNPADDSKRAFSPSA
jgi:hypothetical protein